MNQVILFGNVGMEPVRKELESGTPVTTFTLATSKMINGKELTEWHNCRSWREQANRIADNVQKGDRLMVIGELKTDIWEKNGQKVYKTWIEVRQFSISLKLRNGQPEGQQSEPENNLPY